ncbi:MAG TPA: acetyl-CoA carboxylase carboxyltransferase subunit alpha [Ktedonobacteraceae bacterium]|jgi:acetyl-CoA carboxylase carboxyl transferase subunit alpha|nr:acetyl-CoA carboxylase carboxyltransferase subunit alpha [Ktedonobacteraceae bacterium]
MKQDEYDLEFEQPLAELAREIEIMRQEGGDLENPALLQQKTAELHTRLQEIYANLTSWQTVQVARHKNRPRALDYLHLICENMLELHGDRLFGDDPALVGGLATFHGETIVFLAHQKGTDSKDQQYRNFGMPHPEGYRKAYRLMEMAGKFKFPVICLIDTPGAFPGLEDEERGQSEAIAANLMLMARLPVPILAVVIGEGGSGGALAIGVADRLLMLEHSVYTVAAPEAAASILWRDNAFAAQAAEAMRISARELVETHIIDKLIPEPVGGAHRNPALAASHLQAALKANLQELQSLTPQELIAQRYQKYRAIGHFGRLSW